MDTVFSSPLMRSVETANILFPNATPVSYTHLVPIRGGSITMELKFDEKGLIPAIVQDHYTKEVLTLAYMNAETLALTIAEGRTVFWSRSRQGIWRKGETSGKVQRVVSITADCDADALVVEVVLHDGRDQALFIKFQIHNGSPSPDEMCIRDRRNMGADCPDGVFLIVAVGDFIVNFDGVQQFFLGAAVHQRCV